MAAISTRTKFATAALLVIIILSGLIIWRTGWLQQGQVLEGRLTQYHKVYDGWWDVICDTATDGSDQRCYIQYVDVYRPRPEFAAAMVEVVFHKGSDGTPDPHIRFDIEPGLSFKNTKVMTKIAEGDLVLDVSGCESNSCLFTGEAGQEILKAWQKGISIYLEIDEGRAEPSKLDWPLQNISAILDDFAAQRQQRNLP